MAVTTFAAIDIGSYEISMKIFEFSKKIGFRELNDVRYRLEIGKGAYSRGRLEPEMVDDICVILKDFSNMMQEFGVSEYRACATSAFREIVNPVIVQEQIYQRTGIRIEILSNAEQHFLGYKSIAAIESGFKKIIQKGTAILDVGGGNLQVSLFDKDALVTTQSFKMGSMRIRERLKELEKKIGYTFENHKLLERAMMHSSYTNEKHLEKYRCNERLEFLGDAVLELISSEYLFGELPRVSEGELTKTRASMVCEPSLAMCARDIDLGSYLLLGKGEEATGGRMRDSITSDAMEALIGAIYLDGGFTSAKEFIHRFILTDLEDKKLFYDSKTILQEIVQANKAGNITYELVGEEGPDHNKTFEVRVRIGGQPYGSGKGRSKKAAEQKAAYQAIIMYRSMK